MTHTWHPAASAGTHLQISSVESNAIHGLSSCQVELAPSLLTGLLFRVISWNLVNLFPESVHSTAKRARRLHECSWSALT